MIYSHNTIFLISISVFYPVIICLHLEKRGKYFWSNYLGVGYFISFWVAQGWDFNFFIQSATIQFKLNVFGPIYGPIVGVVLVLWSHTFKI